VYCLAALIGFLENNFAMELTGYYSLDSSIPFPVITK
jgi:hypothetical protein